MAGMVETRSVLRPGDVVTFTASAFDPQDKRLSWRLATGQMTGGAA